MHGNAKAGAPIIIAVVQHEKRSAMLEYVRVGQRKAVPAVLARAQVDGVVLALPRDAIGGFGITDPILVAATGEPHTVGPIVLDDARARNGVLLWRSVIDRHHAI